MPIMPNDIDLHDPIAWAAYWAGWEAGNLRGYDRGIATVATERKGVGGELRQSPLWPPVPSWDERELQLRNRRRNGADDLSGEQLRDRAAASWGLCDVDHGPIVTQ